MKWQRGRAWDRETSEYRLESNPCHSIHRFDERLPAFLFLVQDAFDIAYPTIRCKIDETLLLKSHPSMANILLAQVTLQGKITPSPNLLVTLSSARGPGNKATLCQMPWKSSKLSIFKSGLRVANCRTLLAYTTVATRIFTLQFLVRNLHFVFDVSPFLP